MAEPVIPVACWAYVGRKFHDVYAARRSPMAQEALERIAALYVVEKAIRGRPPDKRRQVRQKRSRPVTGDLFAGMGIAPPKLSGRSDLAARLNGLDPQACLADVIARIRPHPASRLLPCNWQPAS